MTREKEVKGNMMKEVMKMGLAVLLLISAVISTSCSRNCGDNGTCDQTTGTCSCSSGWGGDDCSLQMKVLDGGGSLTDEVGTRGWLYYSSFVPNNVISMTYFIQQQNSGDCDFYVKAGSIPSKSYYDAKDTTIESSFSVTLPVYSSTTYYAGLYGYRDCAFIISLSFTSGTSCLNECSGHGDCDFGHCICDSSHYGDDCSSQIEELSESKSSYEKEAGAGEWNYYFTRTVMISEPNHTFRYSPFYITFSQSEHSTTTGNIVYLRSLSLPTAFDYDYRNAVETNHEIIVGVGHPDETLYYIAVYTPSSSSYLISITYNGFQECVEQCCGHGSCIGGEATCYCDDGYSGNSCESLDDPIEDSVYYSGYASNNVWNYFHFSTNSQSNVLISLTQLGDQSTDCDLYVLSDNQPTKSSYTYRDITSTGNITLVVINPLGHTWFIGVYGAHLCSFQLMQTIQPRCPNDCTGNGVCENERCLCVDGWTGEACAYPYQIMSGVSSLFTSSIHSSFWHYFKYTIDESVSITSITVSLKEVSSTGYINVFLQRGSLPTLTEFLDADLDQSTSIHSVYSVSTSGSRDFYIGVYGSSFIPLSQSFSYKLGVYSPKITFD